MVVGRSHRFIIVPLHLGLAETLKSTTRRYTIVFWVCNKVIIIYSLFRQTRTVGICNDVTLNSRESSRHDWRGSCNSVNEIEADCQQESNDWVCLEASLFIVTLCEDTVLPNNVCRLGRSLKFNRLAKKGLISFQFKSKDASIFLFKSNKGSGRSCQWFKVFE